jgi:phage terminase large subunit-like protein
MMLPNTLPKHTLGWDLLDWASEMLVNPDGEFKGDPWYFTKEQARFILWFYAVDENGRFLYRRALLARPKGWGKSPLLASISVMELLAPVQFDGWDYEGNPVGRPSYSPLIQLAAVSEAQTDNTMSLVIEMLSDGPAYDYYNLDIGKSRILVPGGKLEPVTAQAKSREGQRPTFAVLDETHLWTPSNGGDKLAATIRRNLGKINGRSVETTNAYLPGEESVAEDSHAYWEAIGRGEVINPGLMYDFRSSPPDTPYERGPERRKGLIYAYGDAAKENGGWVDLDRIEQEMDDPATKEADGRRFYFNQITQGSMQWIDPVKWNACYDNHLRPLSRDDAITIGFDGGLRDDSTALIACRIEDGALFVIHVWEKPDGAKNWEVDFVSVDLFVREMLENYNVVRMNCDPAYWQDIVGRWAIDFEGIVWEWWTNRKKAMAESNERFSTAVATGALKHKNEEVLTRHVLNAHVEETPWGDLLRKDIRGGSRKIDAAVAAVLAYEARGEAIEDGFLQQDASSYVYSF